MRLRLLSCLSVLLGAATAVGAAGADVERGRLVAHGGGGGDAAACFRCHGLAGGGDPALAAPRLAGLPEFYLAKQMRDFVRGSRPDPVMTPIAKALDDADRRAVAAFYAGLPVPSAAAAEAPDGELGRRVAEDGDPSRDLPPCAACHGRTDASPAPAIPALAGQPASYLALQLHHWRSGRRRNDPLAGMRRFAEALRPEEVDAVARWYASRRPEAAR